MFDPFGVHAFLDHPDIASLAAPCAIFVQNCARDTLFSRPGMESAPWRKSVYTDLRHHPERFRSEFYDAAREFNQEGLGRNHGSLTRRRPPNADHGPIQSEHSRVAGNSEFFKR